MSSHSSQALTPAGIASHKHPRTPSGKKMKPKIAVSTPPSYTFNDDDEFYPGTDPRLKRNGCGISPRLPNSDP
ncbi:uncharacterized protein CTRU02_203198 [Colletotrichum truncatum]|uniref:Uncharacterized protein n=1 Tax=Colletotrichum truncatum TaxID=5467 RepID=A0ACC3Z8N3_COLTU|nr:uncharacterized protein CTRU02_09038 [Colletotrichum truncatum]KAF6789246.1 hypothetical protein CTRU02_09038 [Colletotrichum truncatum]